METTKTRDIREWNARSRLLSDRIASINERHERYVQEYFDLLAKEREQNWIDEQLSEQIEELAVLESMIRGELASARLDYDRHHKRS